MDHAESFVKRHGFAIAGIALPVVVVLAFLAVRAVPRFLVDDPAYDLVLSTSYGYSGAPHEYACEVVAVDGRVRARWTRAEQPVYVPPPRVYRLDPVTGDIRELVVPEPGELASVGEHRDLFLDGLEDVRIDTSPSAPDGYRFEDRYAGGSGLFGELFGRDSHGPRATIVKDGRVIVLPQVGQNAYDPRTFIGWAIPAVSGR